MVGAWFSCPAYAENDTGLAALAEHWLGAAQGAGDFIQPIAGRRSGAGMMLGSLSHLDWDSAVVDAIHNAAAPARIFADAQVGNAEAAAAVDRFARVVAQDLAAVVLIVNPTFRHGWLSRAGEAVTTLIRSHLGHHDGAARDVEALGRRGAQPW